MFRSTFFRRLFVPYLILICGAIAGVGAFAAVRMRSVYLSDRRQSLRDDLHLIAELLKDDLSAGRLPAVAQRIKSLGESLSCRITVVAGDGTVLADNWADPGTMENHARRPEILGAIRKGEESSTRRSGTVRSDLFYLASHHSLSSGQEYYLRMAVLVKDLDREVHVLYGGLAVAAVIAMAIAAAIGFHFARRQSTPIVELTDVAQAVARGDLQRRSDTGQRGELGALARATNTMAESLNQLLSQAEEGKAELLAMLASMSDGVIATDNQQRIRVANEAAGVLLGFQAAQAIGRPLWQVVRIDLIIKTADRVLQTGEACTDYTGPITGRHLELRIRRFPQQGQPHGLVLVAHDVTESVRYQELRKEFVANVSHELRTPLSVISGFIETLADGAMHDPEKGPEYLATIQRHARQLTNLVNDLLAISRLEGRPDLPHRASVDLAAAARKIADLLLPAAQAKSQTLTVEGAPASQVVGEADYLERAISNLVDNAIKYTPEGGRIEVFVKTVAESVVLEVVDNGIGIPAEDLPRIFERFYRVDRSRSREMGGTGLGLSIVKHVAQVHGGSVELQSTPGKGSTFRLILPASPRLDG